MATEHRNKWHSARLGSRYPAAEPDDVTLPVQ
jgi:hypothetical protein